MRSWADTPTAPGSPSLAETQARVLAALLRGDGDGGAAPLVRVAGGIAPARRLQVYRNNVQASLGAALAAVYPVVERLVGAACFRALARRYVFQHPSRSGNLHAFGDALPAFVRRCAELAELAWLPDVAALEWALHCVYHEADDAPLTAADLQGVPNDAAPTLGLRLRRASQLLLSRHPALAIWQANRPAADGQLPAEAFRTGGDRLLVARGAQEVEFRRLDAAEFAWLRRLADGCGLADAVHAALAVDPGFDLGTALARHLGLGTFAAADPAEASR
jgi:hypothetical protein